MVDGDDQLEGYVIKEKSEWTKEENIEVLKDAKVRKKFHNALDVVMSNRVITCKTKKYTWDALKVQCQGTIEIKKNMRSVLTHESEYFDAKANESLTEIYDRFLTLLNELALVGKKYSNEDSNTKFMRAPPKEWDLKTTIIRDNTILEDVSLDKIYERLKTHDLEIQHRRNIKSTRTKSVALNSKVKTIENFSSSTRRKSNHVKRSEVEPEEDSDGNTNKNSDGESSDVEIEEMLAMMVKGFKRMKNRKFRTEGNLSKQTLDDAKAERFKKKDEREKKSRKFDKAKVKCNNYDGMGHFATKCRMAKSGKLKALISEKKDWMNSSDSDEEVNYALMANVEAESPPSEKVPNVVYNFDSDNMVELKSFLKSLHLSFKSQTL